MNRRRAIINSRKHRLPVQYQEVEYIQTTGDGQILYIDSGCNNVDIDRIVADWARMESSTIIAGCSTDDIIQSNYYHSFAQLYYGGFRFRVGDWRESGGVCSECVKYHIDATLRNGFQQIKVDGNIVVAKNEAYIPQNANVRLFIGNLSSLQYAGRCYGIKLYSDDELVRDYVPCYRKSDSKPGLYDLVNGDFYTNANTTSNCDFVIGPDID